MGEGGERERDRKIERKIAERRRRNDGMCLASSS
jgi:hypothetical protein